MSGEIRRRGSVRTGGSLLAGGLVACAARPTRSDAGLDAAVQTVSSVSGVARESDGGPLADLAVTVCGTVCWGARTRVDWTFTVPTPGLDGPERFGIELRGWPAHATWIRRLSSSARGLHTLDAPLVVPAFTAFGDPIPLDGRDARVTVDALTFTLAAGTRVRRDPEVELAGEAGSRLTAVALDPASTGIAAGLRLAALWAVGPFATTFDPPVAVEVRGVSGLAPGAPVQLLALVADPLDAAYGALRPVATAHVSPDGSRVQTDPGEGLTELTWIGLSVP